MSEDRDLSGLTESPKRKDRQIKRPPPPRRSRSAASDTDQAADSDDATAEDAAGGGVASPTTTDSTGSDAEAGAGTVEPADGDAPVEPAPSPGPGSLALDDERVVKKNLSLAGSLKTRLEEATAAERLSYGELVLDAVDRHGDRLPHDLSEEDRNWFIRRRRRRRRGSGVRTAVAAYLTPSEWARVDRLANEIGMDRSTFVAEALRRRLGLSREEAHSG